MYEFTARWPVEPHAVDRPMAALRREVLGDLPGLLAEAGAVLLCEPMDMRWRVDSGTQELVATAPARSIAERPFDTERRSAA
jgi:hypothetical protein